jgi:tetratricopeptide (TPR) repeat protein/predicted Ser/Thr protein kinase
MSCPRGHQWDDLFDDQMSLGDGQARCPVCGIALETAATGKMAEAPGQLPSPRRSTAKIALSSAATLATARWEGEAEKPAPAPAAPHATAELPRANKDIPTVVTAQQDSPQAVSAPTLTGYEILAELGRGGMGVVYLARQTGLNRLVALKMVLGGGFASPALRRRFRLEAQAVARLHHPNIVQIYDVGEQDEHPYFTLEYVEGSSLSDRLSGKPLPPREAAELLEVLARAIHCAHDRGIVHRDLKPGNVLLARDGTPKITDFGLAKLVDGKEAHTRTGSVVGTPSYMAPEQALGQNRTIGPAADIYSLGSILYEALTGRPPFRGETPMDLLYRLAHEDPELLSRVRPGVPSDLETICLKCLQKEPRKRYATALALAEDLRRFLDHEPIRARPAGFWERGIKWVKRRPTKAAFVVCLVVAGLGFSAQAGFQAASSAHAEWQRLENTRAEIHDVLLRAQEAVMSQAWEAAGELLASAESKIESDPALAALSPEADDLLRFVHERLRVHKIRQEFLHERDEALFHATLSLGEGSSHDLLAARDKARAALALVGMTLQAGAQWTPDAAFTGPEQEELREKSYELLLILAEVEGQALPGQSAEEQRRCAQDALRILDHAPSLELRTRAYHLRRARFLELAGEREAAQAEGEQAEQQPAQSALDHYLLGDELYRQGRPQEASVEFQQTLREQADHFWARYFLSLCYIRLQRPDLAHDNLTMCLSQHPEIIWIYLMRGFASGQLEKYQAAEADFAEALRLLTTQPNDDARYVLYNNRAIMRVGQKDFERAIADLRRAITMRPNQYQAYASLAQTFSIQKRPDEAVRQLSEAIKTAELLAQSQEVEAATLALLYRSRARFQRERKDDQAALVDLQRAAALAPAASTLLAQVQIERGQLLNQSRRPQDALAAFDAALQAAPRHAPAHGGRGEALLRLKRYAEAIEAFTAYLDNGGRATVAVYQARALARIKLGTPQAALADLSLALQLEPNNATILTHRGQAFLACQNDQNQSALSDFEDAIRSNPSSGPAYSGRARVRLELGQVSDALADVDTALSLGPPTATLVYSAATVYARAVAKLDADPSRKTRVDAETRVRYQDQALALVEQALLLLPEDQRAAFWRETVQRDSALAAIRHNMGFVRLLRQYSPKDHRPEPP